MTSAEEITWGMELFLGLIIAVVAAVMTGAIVSAIHGPYMYSSGYCTALGGTRLNNEACDVGGKVVAVRWP